MKVRELLLNLHHLVAQTTNLNMTACLNRFKLQVSGVNTDITWVPDTKIQHFQYVWAWMDPDVLSHIYLDCDYKVQNWILLKKNSRCKKLKPLRRLNVWCMCNKGFVRPSVRCQSDLDVHQHEWTYIMIIGGTALLMSTLIYGLYVQTGETIITICQWRTCASVHLDN